MTAPHVYVECDVPPGMTLAAWRRRGRARRRRSLRSRLIAIVTGRHPVL